MHQLLRFLPLIAIVLIVAACGSSTGNDVTADGGDAVRADADPLLRSAVVAPADRTGSGAGSESQPESEMGDGGTTDGSGPATAPELEVTAEPAGVADGDADEAAAVDGSTPTSSSTPTTALEATTVTTPAPTSSAPGATETSPTAGEPPAPNPAGGATTRQIIEQAFTPFASFDGVVLFHPSHRVERIGFHEANHDGARQLEPLATAIDPVTMESRRRGTGSRTAADIVVDPAAEIRAPVTGTVLRAGGYVLYCDHQDSFIVIEPDGKPGWEVKVLHVNGTLVGAGDRVEAGVTVIAPGATVFPFDSQVDEFTAEPSWPHVHIEMVDTSIPDKPAPGSGGGSGC